MRSILFLTCVCLSATAVPALGTARAQPFLDPLHPQQTGIQQPSQIPLNPSRPTMPSIDGRNNQSDDPNAAIRQAQVARLQNSDRHKRLVDDTNKLLKLANELKDDVDKSNKDQMSLDVIRKADEVERLAHDVKLKMRG